MKVALNNRLHDISILLIVFFSAPIYALEISKPRFLVEKQPIPPAIGVKADLPISSVDYTSAGQSFSTHQAHTDVESYLVPVVSTRQNLIIVGPGYMSDRMFDARATAIPAFMNGVYANIFATGSIGEKWFWLTYQSYGWFDSQLTKATVDSGKYFQFANFGYKWNEKFSISAGALYASNFGNHTLLPLLNLSWSIGYFILDVALPLRAEIRFIPVPEFHLIASGKFFQTSYRDAETGGLSGNTQYIQLTRVEAALSAEIRIASWSWLTTGVKYLGETRYAAIGQMAREMGVVIPEIQIFVGAIIRPD